MLDQALCSIPEEEGCESKEEFEKETTEAVERGKKLLPKVGSGNENNGHLSLQICVVCVVKF